MRVSARPVRYLSANAVGKCRKTPLARSRRQEGSSRLRTSTAYVADSRRGRRALGSARILRIEAKAQ
jgi:hypothetical protein